MRDRRKELVSRRPPGCIITVGTVVFPKRKRNNIQESNNFHLQSQGHYPARQCKRISDRTKDPKKNNQTCKHGKQHLLYRIMPLSNKTTLFKCSERQILEISEH